MPSPKKVKIGLAICLACLIMSGCGKLGKSEQELAAIHLQQANSYLKTGQFRAAIIEAKNVRKKAPNDIDGYIITSKIFNELGQYKQTIDLLESLPQSFKSHAALEEELVRAYIGKRKFHSALNALDKADALKNHDQAAYILLRANCLRELGKFKQASEIYTKLIQENGNNVEAHIGFGLVSFYQNDNKQAQTSLEKALSIAPEDPSTSLQLAKIHYTQKNYETAEDLLTDTLLKLPNTDTVTPERATTLSLLADVLVQQGRTTEAMIYTQKLADNFPGYDLALQSYEEAEALAKDGNTRQAEVVLEQLLADNPGFERATTLLAIIKYMKGDYASASTFLADGLDAETAHPDVTRMAALSHLKSQKPSNVIDLLEGYPTLNDDTQLLTIYGTALLAANKPNEAKIALERAITLEPENTSAYLSLANYFASVNAAEEALKQLQKAQEIHPDNPQIIMALIKHHVGSGNITKAEAIVQQQIESNSDSAIALDIAGDFYSFQKQYKKASEFYIQSLNLDPQNSGAAFKNARMLDVTGAASTAVLSAYQKALVIDPDNPAGYESMLRYGKRVNQKEASILAAEQSANKSNSSIGFAVLTIFQAREGDVDSALRYRKKIDDSRISGSAVRRVEETLYTVQATQALVAGDLSIARETAHKGLKFAPASPVLMQIIANIELSQNNYREAEKIIMQIASVKPSLAAQLKGDLHYAQEQFADALASYQNAWQQNNDEQLGAKIYHLISAQEPEQRDDFLKAWKNSYPNSIYIKEIESRNLLAANNHDAAIPLMEKIRLAQPENAENLNNLAWSYFKTNHEAALPTAKKAYKLQPDNAYIIDTYAWILFKKGNANDAKNLINKAAELMPDNTEILAHQQSINESQ